ncbi:MAG TPA: hypothetical protein VKY32_09470 [Flavobacterium sp.]|nr:hypothetical protein [Flavobacterium sp.]
MRLFIFSFLLLFHVNAFSQQLIVRFDEDCHNENSEILLDVLENALGEKRVKKIIEEKENNAFYNFNIGKQNEMFKLYLEFDKYGNIIEMNFVANTHDVLNSNQRKKVIQFIKNNNINFNICWGDLSNIGKFTIEERQRLSKVLENELSNDKQPYYSMNVHFPGYITQKFYDKYSKELEQR